MSLTTTIARQRHRDSTIERDLHRRRLLCRFDDHRPFAYAYGRDFIRCSDHTLWAHLTNGKLLSARSGQLLAYQHDNLFYDADTHQPIYYQSHWTHAGSTTQHACITRSSA
jgi:hypothetical protein